MCCCVFLCSPSLGRAQEAAGGDAPIDAARFGGFEFVRERERAPDEESRTAVDDVFSPLDPVIVDADAVRLPEDQRLD
ncbi:MAG: hypothetical protein AAF515_13915 [Pseudomonadota bacterium]